MPEIEHLVIGNKKIMRILKNAVILIFILFSCSPSDSKNSSANYNKAHTIAINTKEDTLNRNVDPESFTIENKEYTSVVDSLLAQELELCPETTSFLDSVINSWTESGCSKNVYLNLEKKFGEDTFLLVNRAILCRTFKSNDEEVFSLYSSIIPLWDGYVAEKFSNSVLNYVIFKKHIRKWLAFVDKDFLGYYSKNQYLYTYSTILNDPEILKDYERFLQNIFSDSSYSDKEKEILASIYFEVIDFLLNEYDYKHRVPSYIKKYSR